VGKGSSSQDADVQAIIDAGRQSVGWVRHEFAGVDLGDERLDRRLIKTVELLAKSPLSPINEACGCWADTQAAYRGNEKAHSRNEWTGVGDPGHGAL